MVNRIVKVVRLFCCRIHTTYEQDLARIFAVTKDRETELLHGLSNVSMNQATR
jgi:hypothetical protein